MVEKALRFSDIHSDDLDKYTLYLLLILSHYKVSISEN